jgi:acetone carboxylase gamma subunit
MKKDRLGWSKRPSKCTDKSDSKNDPIGVMINEYLRVCRSAETMKYYYQCNVCNSIVCEISDSWKNHILMHESPILPSGDGISSIRSEFVLREFFCPSCGTMVDVEVAREGEELLHDEILI